MADEVKVRYNRKIRKQIMETQARIEQVFQEKGVARGGERYLRVSDARDLLADLVDAGRAVVGIEGVELREGGDPSTL